MKISDWEVKVKFKNFAEYLIEFESLRYLWAASKPGNFGLAVPLNAETMDILRGSEVTFLFKGEEAFTGKITNKIPNFESKIITFEGLDWPGLMSERQISFMSYDKTGYSWASGAADDSWDYAGGTTGVPGMIQDLEGAELILLLLRHFTGRDINDTEFGDPTNMPYVDRSITRKQWIFEGETLTQSIEKVAKVMQASNLRFGYNFWVDGKKNWWLRRYGDQVYSKRMNAKWSPPKEDVSTIINHLHFIGGIATPFPSDRESLTDYSFSDVDAIKAENRIDYEEAIPTSASKGWGCWVKRSGYDSSGHGYIQVEGDGDLGFVTGADEKSLHITMHQATEVDSRRYSMGFYYSINNSNSEYKDSNYPDGELRNWSNRHQLNDRKSHRVMTLTFYIRADLFEGDICGAKLKIYTGGSQTFPPTENPATDVYETSEYVYDLDIIDILSKYKDKMTGWDNDEAIYEWMRVSIVFHEDLDVGTYAELKTESCPAPPSGGDIRYKIEAIFEQGGNLDVLARWNNFSDKNLPDPEDVWGFGIEFTTDLDSGDYISLAFDHIFFGFGEIEVERWDDISMQANRHVEKWIQDRKCHAWPRAEHLADVLLDSMKYAQKSRTGTLRYFNPELRPNLLIPIREYGTEWLYVLNQIAVSVTPQGTNMKLTVGSPQPDPDELFEFYELQRVNMESGGAGRGVFNWAANSKCQTNCERYCQFACLSDWSPSYKRGGSICQTAREITCLRCEMASELNPCVVSCLKYSQIAAISQRPPAERTDVDNTLLMGDGYLTGVIPEKPVAEKKEPSLPLKCRVRTREVY